ncbi:unnamed protein product [Meloidogyne enterolobii]|uniref:Uncharacterized protein n=1 Tax=Meloidogyne enterolobii TaxID=390850 RepID=A0ACB1A1S1_MELEN
MSDTKMNNFPQLKQNLIMNGSDPFNHLINQPHSTTNSPSSSSASSSFTSTKNNKNDNFNPVHRLHKSEDSTTNLINRLPLNIPSAMLTEEELDGGELLSVEEREEIDPEDGCKVQVWTYRILSADGMEESTIIRRRKMKVNCTESLKRIEFSNGRETKYEEREVINNLDSFTQQPNHTPFRNSSATNERTMEDVGNKKKLKKIYLKDEDSAQIGSMLFQTQDSFLRLVREKKDALVKLFPELFTNLRTTPAIFESMPSTVMETIVNEDGSTTTRTKFSKAFSSHYTRQEMFINGVRKECRSRFRAFMEYAGPEGGFCIRLNDHADEDLSEEESNDHEESTSDGKSWISSSGRSLALSEIGEGQSALVIPGKQGQLCVLKDKENNKRWEKAWHAVNEMVQSEERYVQKLALLEKFRSTIERAQLLDRRLQCHLFSNIASLNQFHEQHLLPQLMDRRREWQGTKRISDVLRKQAPFLKMYSEYTNNYKTAVHIFEECMRKKRAFGEIVRQLEQLPECEHLSLVSHLICPVQRVMRYQLLLKEYQKNLLPNDPDWEDTETALTLVLEAASHANEMMRKLDRYRNVLEIQEQLGNSIALVSPGRELLTRSRLFKCSSSTGKVEERLGPQRCVELFCETEAEKKALFDTVWSVIQEAHSKELNNNHFVQSPQPTDNQQPKKCARCNNDFGWYAKQIECQRCGQRYCKKCIAQKPQKMCLNCLGTIEGLRNSRSEGPLNIREGTPITRKNLLQVPASGNVSDVVKSGYLKFRGHSDKQLRRFFVLRNNFCIYSYRSDQDNSALAMLPLSGCDVNVHSSMLQAEKFGISLRHMNRQYLFICENEFDHAEWLAAMLLSANAKLPGEESSDEENVDLSNIATTIGPEQQKPKHSFASSLKNPWNSLIRRSSSMGETRIEHLEKPINGNKNELKNGKNEKEGQLRNEVEDETRWRIFKF